MFRVMDLRDGKVETFEGSDQVAPPPDGVLRWIDLRAQDLPQLELLRERFDFHPLAIEDCGHQDQRPKLEEYRDHLFLVTQGFSCAGHKVHELGLHELHTFLGERYLVTVHLDSIAALEEVWVRVAKDPKMVGRGLDFVYYLIADGIVDDNFPIIDYIADELEEIEDAVLSRPQRKDLQRIFELKHHLVAMRKVLSPQRDVIGMLAKRGDPRITDRTALYLRDVYDHLVRMNESIEANRDLLGNALEAYLSAVGQRTNEIMKALTIMSAVFLPLAFVVGFFGQNFDDLPGMHNWTHSDGLMWVMISLCVGLPVGMLGWFRHKGWL
jgi:magnesium transporter